MKTPKVVLLLFFYSNSGDEPSSSQDHLPTEIEVPSSRESRVNKKRQADRESNHKRAKRSKHSEKSEEPLVKSSGTTEAGSGSGGTGRGGGGGGGQKEVSRERLWVAPNLRVRIVDTSFKRGKYYNNKVRLGFPVLHQCIFLCTGFNTKVVSRCFRVLFLCRLKSWTW